MERSIVEYLSGHERYNCGYCHSSDSCYSHGMWAHSLAPIDYQYLIDRGWRRSGKYCYKPTMNRTCCPLYTIRCAAMELSLTRSQKKVLKKVYRFLAYGEKEKQNQHLSSKDTDCGHHMDVSEVPHEIDIQSLKQIKKMRQLNHSDIKTDVIVGSIAESSSIKDTVCNSSDNSSVHSSKQSSQTSSPAHPLSLPTTSPGPSSTRPPCRKAKEIRKERKLQKLLKLGISQEEAAATFTKKPSEPKSVEDFLHEPLPPESAHKLELRLVPCDIENPLFKQTFEESYSVYKKYQMMIHEDPVEKCSSKQFARFLVTSPFQPLHIDPPPGKFTYGSYHQQYWLDGKLIAVAVIDVLPFCVSSVYFYYDPDYNFLSLGTYAALREIALARELNKELPDLQFYYMGFYIHSCIKMRYKGQFVPSFLLCPETYIFHPMEKSKSKLEIAKYSRLEEDPTKVDTDATVNLRDVVILYDRTRMTYNYYKRYNREANDENEVREYAGFVGRKCYTRIMLYREHSQD